MKCVSVQTMIGLRVCAGFSLSALTAKANAVAACRLKVKWIHTEISLIRGQASVLSLLQYRPVNIKHKLKEKLKFIFRQNLNDFYWGERETNLCIHLFEWGSGMEANSNIW